MTIWTDERAREQYHALLQKVDVIFKVPPEIARAEPHVFTTWFYERQKDAALLRIQAATLFLTFTKAPE